MREQVLGLALQFAAELEQQGFEIINEVVFNQVLAATESEAITKATIAAIQRSGECWVGGTSWQGRQVIRVSICSWATSEADVSHSVKAFVAARRQAESGD